MASLAISNNIDSGKTQFVPEEVIARVKQVVQETIVPNAKELKNEFSFPKANFEALHNARILEACVDQSFGGIGIDHKEDNIDLLWSMTTEIASGDMSTARCWEGHNNAVVLLNNVASYEQKERWFKGIIDRGEVWTVWSGEPLLKTPGQKQSIGTRIEETEKGYILHGSKVFCSSATGASKAILLVNTEGIGAARHATAAPESLLMLACDLKDDTITMDDSWWNPIGMRGSVSYRVEFNGTFIPKENKIGYGGQFLLEDWQTRFVPQYAATFLGGAKAAYRYAKQHIESQKRENDPYVQHRIAKMAINISTAEQWLRSVAEKWGENNLEDAKLMGNMCRYTVEQLASECVEHAVHICGARGLIRPSELERIVRDLTIYTRHDNDDQLLATVGKACLGQNHDKSFYNTK